MQNAARPRPGNLDAGMKVSSVTKTSNFTFNGTTVEVVANAAGGLTGTLEDATAVDGRVYMLANIGAGDFDLAPVMGQTINGLASATLIQNETKWIKATAGNWLLY